MESILGTSIGVFIGLTLLVMGFAAFMTGQALANMWKPVWQVLVYGVLLGFADRFLAFGLFEGELLSITGYIIDTVVLSAVSFFGYRVTQARKIVSQYPWLYERSGLFGWRQRRSGEELH